MKIVILLPLLLAACGNTWPSGSYVDVQTADTAVLAPAVCDCVSSILPDHATLALAPASGVLPGVLADAVQRSGMTLAPDGQPVVYVVAPVGDGAFIRVTGPRAACSQYFSRTNGQLKIAGPIMVITR
jgi:hypothetical protein